MAIFNDDEEERLTRAEETVRRLQRQRKAPLRATEQRVDAAANGARRKEKSGRRRARRGVVKR